MSNVADAPKTDATAEAEAEAAESRARLDVLNARLTGKGYTAEVCGNVLTVYRMPADDGPVPALTVTCRRRASDGDRWWFKTGEDWIDEASHVVDTVVWVVGRLGGGA